ncbi:methyltransferase domain-containing protein [Danxiaibacter flavus]|uniref:Methyltransferase domain-containing protein n=1 Tax=Danxiaibacter flavus TaxID=3049108 RepID=A0ABV3ZIW3_9BACT|nr:methyltransferase domain-containing protein [Chitinophagaceae bacterium DXS]
MIDDNKCCAVTRFRSDRQFNDVFPPSIRKFADRHWTPLSVARKVADYLSVKKGSKILDIGSGAGKFCLAAAHYKPEVQFFGVEQRKSLVDEAEAAKKTLGIRNAFFLHGNFMQTNFDLYDHFYFFNSFYENLVWGEKIDNTLEYSENLYHYYNRYLYKLLASRPDGTRLVTYHSVEDEVPTDYQLVGSHLDGLLKFWIKISGLNDVDHENDHPYYKPSRISLEQQEKMIVATGLADRSL